MPYRLVKGEVALFRPNPSPSSSRPDGDSVWFKPDNLALLTDFQGRSFKPNASGFGNLRLEAIDALETHFAVTGGIEHQPLEHAKSSRDALLSALGFTSVTYGSDEQAVINSTPKKIKAHILTRGLDGTNNHRPISFLYPGNHPKADGTDVFLSASVAGKSVNAKLTEKGLVYPLYYDTLPPDIRDGFTKIANDAFNTPRGLWDGVDSSNDWNTVKGLADLRVLAIWPKLYRRLADYFARVPTGNIKGFDQALRNAVFPTLKDDSLTIVASNHVETNANLHDIYEINGTNKIRLKYYPEEIIAIGD